MVFLLRNKCKIMSCAGTSLAGIILGLVAVASSSTECSQEARRTPQEKVYPKRSLQEFRLLLKRYRFQKRFQESSWMSWRTKSSEPPAVHIFGLREGLLHVCNGDNKESWKALRTRLVAVLEPQLAVQSLAAQAYIDFSMEWAKLVTIVESETIVASENFFDLVTEIGTHAAVEISFTIMWGEKKKNMRWRHQQMFEQPNLQATGQRCRLQVVITLDWEVNFC